MSKINDGGPAFPRPSPDHAHAIAGLTVAPHPGMSYRQWLVGMALAGSAAKEHTRNEDGEILTARDLAWAAVRLADAAIAELGDE